MSDRKGASARSPGSGDSRDMLKRLFRSSRTNALLGWLLVGVLAVVFVESLLDVDFQWIAFVAAVGVAVLVPPLAYREWRVMLPSELLVLALLPVLVRALVGGTVGTFATYLSVAGLALIVTVELHTFTDLEVTHWFAVAFVVLATLASVAAWTIVRWYFDRLLGTSYLSTNEALMTEWLSVAAAGLVAGVVFDAYFRRRDKRLRRAIRGFLSR